MLIKQISLEDCKEYCLCLLFFFFHRNDARLAPVVTVLVFVLHEKKKKTEWQEFSNWPNSNLSF